MGVAVDTALLDLMARNLGVPVHTLLGGAFRVAPKCMGPSGVGRRSREVAEVAPEQYELAAALQVDIVADEAVRTWPAPRHTISAGRSRFQPPSP